MPRLFVFLVFLAIQLLSESSADQKAAQQSNAKSSCKEFSAKPLFRICGIRTWYLIGNSLTPGANSIQFTVDTNASAGPLEIFIDNQPKDRIIRANNHYTGKIDISDLTIGHHSLIIKPGDHVTPALKWVFFRSHPLYVLLTTDWDTSDSKDAILKLHEELHLEHPTLKITHFLGPYTFTDSAVSPSRREYIANWILRLRDTYKDEIGLHIHPYCNFVNTVTSVDCRIKPSDTYKRGDSSGYTVLSAAYGEVEFLRMLKAADDLFINHGLGKSTAFRTGSWAADRNTLNALAADGFVADSSANNWRRIREESENDGNGVLYDWNRKHWQTINDRSQPYTPSQDSPMKTGSPAIHLLEVPDNGSLVDYVTGDEMISIFKANWHDQALHKPATFVFGFHPVSYDKLFHKRIEKTLNYIDHFLAENNDGPVVYETLSRMTKAFPVSAH